METTLRVTEKEITSPELFLASRTFALCLVVCQASLVTKLALIVALSALLAPVAQLHQSTIGSRKQGDVRLRAAIVGGKEDGSAHFWTRHWWLTGALAATRGAATTRTRKNWYTKQYFDGNQTGMTGQVTAQREVDASC